MQCYKYNVFGNDTDVQLQITTYSGRVTVQANPGSIPAEWKDFKIKSPDTEAEDTEVILDIRPWQRQHMGGSLTGLYYICVRGELMSTYTLKLKEFTQVRSRDGLDLQGKAVVTADLQDGYSEFFYARNDSMQVFTYNVPKLDYSQEDIRLEVSIAIKRGNVELQLAAAPCESEDINQCLSGFSRSLVFQKGSRYQKANMINSQVAKLVIDHDEAKCANLLHDNC